MANWLETDHLFPPGWRADLEDRPRLRAGSAPKPMFAHLGESRRTEVNTLSWWPRRNQGNMGSCAGHASANCCRRSYFIELDGQMPDLDEDGQVELTNEDDFSPLYAYYRAQQIDGIRGDNGSTIEGNVKAATEGICREKVMPYRTPYSGRIVDGAKDDARRFKLGRYSVMDTADEAVEWITTGQGGINIGTVWPLPFQRDFPIVTNLPRNARGGGHATAVLDCLRMGTLRKFLEGNQKTSHLSAAAKKYARDDEWILVDYNSHGMQAQLFGFFFFTLNGFDATLQHNFTSAIGMSDMATPIVRKIDWRRVIGGI